MGLLLRSSPLSGSTEGEGVGVTEWEGGSGPVNSHTQCNTITLHSHVRCDGVHLVAVSVETWLQNHSSSHILSQRQP